MKELKQFTIFPTKSYKKDFKALKFNRKDFSLIRAELEKVREGKKQPEFMQNTKIRVSYIKLVINKVEIRVFFHIDYDSNTILVVGMEKRTRAYNKERIRKLEGRVKRAKDDL